ncbi:hypothetical protein OF83DRAFT_1089639, partial [Amylostereum chailletii]
MSNPTHVPLPHPQVHSHSPAVMPPKRSKETQSANLKKPAVSSAVTPVEPKPTKSCKASSTSKKVSAPATQQPSAVRLYDRNPVPLKAIVSTAVDDEANEANEATATRRAGKRVDYRTLHGKGPVRRSSSQVTAEKAEKQAAQAATTALRQTNIKSFAQYEDEVEEKITYERTHAANPPVPSRTKVRQSLDRAPSLEPSDEGSDMPGQDVGEEVRSSQDLYGLPDAESGNDIDASTATTPATTDADQSENSDDSEDSDDMSVRSSGCKNKQVVVSDGSNDGMDVDEEEPEDATVEQEEEEEDEEVVVVKPCSSTKKGVLVRNQVDQERRGSSPGVSETLPVGRKRAATLTAIQSDSTMKKTKDDKKAKAGARAGFSKAAVTRNRPAPPRVSKSEETEDTPIHSQFGGFSESEEEGPQQRRTQAAKGTGVQSKSIAKVERRTVAPPPKRAKPSTQTTAKVFTHTDLPEEVKKHWSVYQATLLAYIGALTNVSNPFFIDNIGDTMKAVFIKVYPGSRLLMKNIAPKEAVYELSTIVLKKYFNDNDNF